MDEFAGRVAVVTGAASGMGRAFSRRFAAEGMRVALADLDAEGAEREAAALRGAGADAVATPTDVTDPASVEALAEAAFGRWGAVHVLCNNAGGGGGARGPIWESPLGLWESVFALNLYGVVHGVRSFVPRMIAMDKEAHVVNTASVSGVVPGGLIYGAAKHAVVSLTETLHLQLRRRGLRVRAHALCPWFVKTALTRRNPDPRAVAAYERGIEPETVAGAVLGALRDGRFYVLPQRDLDELILARARNVVAGGAPASVTPWEAGAGAAGARAGAPAGEYLPSPRAWVAEQVRIYEESGGREGATLRDTGLPVIVVTHRGRRTGAIRKAPLMRVADGDGYVLVGSMGGAPRSPLWCGNLLADPEVEIRDGGRVARMRARPVEDEAERRRLWALAVEAYPPYEDYRRRTDRVFPIFRAGPAADG